MRHVADICNDPQPIVTIIYKLAGKNKPVKNDKKNVKVLLFS